MKFTPEHKALRQTWKALIDREINPNVDEWEKEGAFTGEISAGMLKEAGAEFAIIGHSERRRLFGDTDEIVNRKTLAALQGALCPIVCVGETLEEREASRTLEVLDRQVKAGLSDDQHTLYPQVELDFAALVRVPDVTRVAP